ncbi:hypothetical protein MASR2M70_18470 [Bacillota bacterium]
MRRRLLGLFFVFILLIIALAGRLWWVQIASGGEYARMAKEQSLLSLPEIPVRGTIYDRNNRPLTNSAESYYFIIDERKMDEEAERQIKKIGAQSVGKPKGKYRVFNVIEPDKAEFEKLSRRYDLIAVKHSLRYSYNQPAKHVIGGLDEEGRGGLWGLEKDYDKILSSGGMAFTIRCDGQGYLLRGDGIRVKGDGRSWGIITTLDLDIQQTAEKAFEISGKKGAVIVTDIKSGEILASVSSNGQASPEKSIYDENSGSQMNKAMEGMYPPGPLFYDIAAAAGLMDQTVGLFNASFDRKEGLITPMEVARLMRIAASDGWDVELTLVKGTIEGIRGVFYQPRQPEKPVISAEAAAIMKAMIDNQAENESADRGGWYAGYIAKGEALLGITIFVEDEEGEAGWGKRIFSGIADKILKKPL